MTPAPVDTVAVTAADLGSLATAIGVILGSAACMWSGIVIVVLGCLYQIGRIIARANALEQQRKR